jgi:hypothetical protein
MTTSENTDTTHRVGVYGWSPGTGGVHHHRIAEPLRVLAEYGNVAFTGDQLGDDILNQVDTVLAHTLHTEDATEGWQRLARLDSHRLVLDVDDAMWRPDWQPFKNAYTPEVLRRLYANVAAAHVVTTPSELIAEHLARHNHNVHVIHNTVPAWLVDHDMPSREHLTVGYQGSTHHVRDWPASQRTQLGLFLRDHPDWRCSVYGQDAPPGHTQTRITYHPWQGMIGDYYRSVSMDVGIGPLARTYFNMCKSSLRAIEYAALGIVAVLPDLPPYRGWVVDGGTGRLVHTHQTLRGVLAEVAAHPQNLKAMSDNARGLARGWTTEARIMNWVTAWDSL